MDEHQIPMEELATRLSTNLETVRILIDLNGWRRGSLRGKLSSISSREEERERTSPK